MPRLWQPEHRSTKSLAPGANCCSMPAKWGVSGVGCLMSLLSWPQPTAAAAATVTAARAIRERRGMRPGIIRDPFMRRLAALLLLGALTLAGCGDGPSYSSASDGVLHITLD